MSIFLRAVIAAFTGLQLTVDEQLPAGEAGDVVVSRFKARGTHRGDQPGFPARGRAVTLQGIIVDSLRDGKIVDRHEIADALGLYQQLGSVPIPGQG